MRVLDASLWDAHDRPGDRPTVLVLPYAGGSAHTMREWAAALPHWRVLLAQYPGRGPRLAEPPAPDVPSLAGAVLESCRRTTGSLPDIYLGHSFGSLVAYEAVLQTVAEGGTVQGLVVSGAPTPDRAAAGTGPLGGPTHEQADQQLVTALLTSGGIPSEVAQHPELLELALPSIRADFRLGWEYVRRAPASVLNCPVLALGGDADPDVSPEDLRFWADLTRGPARTRMLPGGHFYFRDGLPHLEEDLTWVLDAAVMPT